MKSKNRKKNNFDNKKAKFKGTNEESFSDGTAPKKFENDPGEENFFQNMKLIASKKRKSGGFQSMGLSYPVLNGVLKRGYKVPTPIQRKTIPIILEGRDVVGMARTGSGKTAAFVVPMLEKLKTHSAQTGPRALILAPTRELSLQTLSFTKQLSKYTSLKSVVVLGGDSMENQFAAIHENPDIIIATPGRFLHLIMEMDLKLSSVNYVVFDEADRLFELGFQDQLREILHRLPGNRQTLLFSATLPKTLVDFAKAGLTEPVLIRLDVESKLSELLKTVHISCRTGDKIAVLLYLLKYVMKPEELTVVFVATKHHVEYLKELLEKALIPCTFVYSSLDSTARKINIAKFQTKKVPVMLVTDLAARGIDIPMLDNVINFNFPPKPKLFVHRVGRVARAGRSGTAYSIIAPDEVSFLIDLHLFLGNPVKFASSSTSESESCVYGKVPQPVIDEEADLVQKLHGQSSDLNSLEKVSQNAMKHYLKSRPQPSSESVKRAKTVLLQEIEIHPVFKAVSEEGVDKLKFLENIKSYRPHNTIFETGNTTKNEAYAVMKKKRMKHDHVIEKSSFQKEISKLPHEPSEKNTAVSMAGENDIKDTFTAVIGTKTMHVDSKKKLNLKDSKYFIPYTSDDFHMEKGLEIEKTFGQEASSAVLDFLNDEVNSLNKQKSKTVWDRKKKRFVQNDEEKSRKKIKTESGAYIPASYKSNLYKQWKAKTHADKQDDEDNEESEFGKQKLPTKGHFGKGKQGRMPFKRELKTADEIMKQRKRKARLDFHVKKKHEQRASRRRNK